MMTDDRVAMLRRAAQCAFGWAYSLPDGPWTSTENSYDNASNNGVPWDWGTFWVEAPRQPVETTTVALAYGQRTGEFLTRMTPQFLRALGALFSAIAGEYESMLTSAHYLDVSDRDAAARLRRGPAGLDMAVTAAQALLGLLDVPAEDKLDDEDDNE